LVGGKIIVMKKILLFIFSTFFIFSLLKSFPVTANENKINHERTGYDVVCNNGFTQHQDGKTYYYDASAKFKFDLIKKKYLADIDLDGEKIQVRNNRAFDKNNNSQIINQNKIFEKNNELSFEMDFEGYILYYKYSILSNILEMRATGTSYYATAICKTSSDFVKVFNQVYNPVIANQLNNEKITSSTTSLSKEDIKEKLQFYKDLYEEELITKEEYENVRKEILSGSINNTTASNQDAQINQVQGQLDLERQKLEEMKRQTELAQQDLQEQKRIADEAAKSNKRNKFNDNMKSAKKGLCLMQGGSFSSC